jgi:hypothetical protein
MACSGTALPFMTVKMAMVPGALKTGSACSTETLVPTYKSVRHHNPEDHHENFRKLPTTQACTLACDGTL